MLRVGTTLSVFHNLSTDGDMLVKSNAHCFQLQIPNAYTAQRGTADQISSTDKGESNEEEKLCSSSQKTEDNPQKRPFHSRQQLLIMSTLGHCISSYGPSLNPRHVIGKSLAYLNTTNSTTRSREPGLRCFGLRGTQPYAALTSHHRGSYLLLTCEYRS